MLQCGLVRSNLALAMFKTFFSNKVITDERHLP
jgi:hypothetical protein